MLQAAGGAEAQVYRGGGQAQGLSHHGQPRPALPRLPGLDPA